MKANLLIKTLVSGFFILGSFGFSKAQTTVNLPEQCDCDTAFLVQDTLLVVGKDTINLNVLDTHLDKVLVSNGYIYYYVNGMVVDSTEISEINDVGTGSGPPTVSGTEDIGEVYIDYATGDIWTFDGTTWVLQDGGVTTGSGSPSFTGTEALGDVYVDNATGDIWTFDGTTWVLQDGGVTTGSGSPSFTGTEVLGDVYVDNATGDIWTFDGTTWVLQDGGVTTGSGSPSFTGTEALGDVYVDNATGDIWTFDGTTWILNNEGSIFSGSGSPVSTDHSDGDIHINNTTGDVFVFDAGTDTWTLISHGASQDLFWSADNDSLLITDGNGVSVDDLSSNVVTTQIFNDSVLSKITQFETVTTLVDNADGTFTYTDEDGGTTIIAKAQLTDNGDSTFIFTNNDGSDVLIDFKGNETTTTLVQNTATGVITYTNEDAAAQLAVLLSTDLGNILTVGTDGGLYLDSATIATYEALTTLVDNADGTFTYTDEDGGTTIIAKAQLTDNGDSTFTFTNNDGSDVLIDFKANETTTTLVQNTVTGVITYTNEDAAAQLAVLLSTDLGNILTVGTDGGLYLDSATIATYEALTTLVDNADGTFTYTDEDGGTTIIAKAQLTDNGDSTFTFTNNDGSDVLIDFKANETTTTLVQNTATGVITYTNEDAAAQLAVLLSTDLGNILTVGTDGGLYLDSATIATYEALTTLVDNADGTFTYTDEDGGTTIIAKAQLTDNGDSTFTFTNNDGSDVLIDFKANETTTTLVQNTATGVITYTNEDAAAQLAVLLSTDAGNILAVGTDGGLYLDSATIATYEALTTLVDNADGTFTYTDEDGGTTIIAKAQLTDNGDSTFTFTNNDGSDVLIDFKANETTTTLVQNTATGVITYTNEDAAAQLAVLLSTDLGNILTVGTDGGLYLDSATIATYEALTTLVDNADGTFTYTDEDGGASIIAKAQITDNGDSTFTFTNNDGSDVLIDFKANETTTTLVQNTATGVITYTNEDAAAQLAVLLSTDLGNILTVGTDGGLYLDSATIATYEALTTLVDNADGTFTYTDEDGGASIIAKAQITDNGDSTFTFTNNDGSDVLIDFKANETTTTLVQNTATGVITYTNEDAAAQLAVLLSTDLGNILTVGTDGGLYLDSATIATYEALTTLVDNADGTFTYTDEDGGTTIIAKAQLTDNGDSTFTFTNNDGSDVLIDFKANETTTTLVQNTATGVITYTNEDAAAQLAVLLSTDAGNILAVGTDGGLYLDSATIATYEALTTLVDNADGTFTYTDEDGGTSIIAKAQLTDNGDSTFTFTNNDGSDVLIDFKANETTTTLVQNTATGVITYTNEDAAAQLAVLLSTDANNILTVGTDGGLFLDSSAIVTDEPWTDEITGIGALSSSDSIYFPGRVAIGTTATDPGKTLTVDGDVRITGVLDPTKLTFSDGSTVSFDPATNDAYEIEYDTRNLAFTNSTSDSVLYLATNSNVGVGTANPTQQLEITQSMEMPTTIDATTGVIYKGTSPFLHDYTSNGTGTNIFLGKDVGNFTNTSILNIGIGRLVMKSLTTGSSNVGIGLEALNANTSGKGNVAIGESPLWKNTTGFDNIAIGNSAMYRNISGEYNAAIGMSALQDNTIGNDNVAIGSAALLDNVSGNSNVGIGKHVLSRSTTANNNTVVGAQSGINITTGSNNVILGYNVEVPNPVGSNQLNIGNLIFGTGLDGLDTLISSGNIGIGVKLPDNKLHVAGDVKIEDMASGAATDSVVMWSPVDSVLRVVDAASIGGADTDWTGAGTGTMYATDTTDAVAIGTDIPAVGKALTVDGDVRITGVLDPTKLIFSDGSTASFDPAANNAYEIEYDTRNLAFTNSTSDSVLYLSTNSNVGVGTANPTQQLEITQSMEMPTTIDATTGIIYKGTSPFLHDYTSDSTGNNVFLGKNTGNFTTTGYSNNAVGSGVLQNITTGSKNTAIGSGSQNRNTTGTGNVSIGSSALQRNRTGSDNIAIGDEAAAGRGITLSRNVFIGNKVAWEILDNANNNIAIGYKAASNLLTGKNNITIGYDIETRTDSSLNELTIGNLLYGTGLDGLKDTISSGNIGIGVQLPDNKLHVAGDVKIEDMASGAATDSVVMWSPVDSVLRVVDAASIGGADTDWTGAGTGTMYATDTTDAVLIGTDVTVAGKALVVDGDVRITGVLDPTKLTFSDGSTASFDPSANNAYEIEYDTRNLAFTNSTSDNVLYLATNSNVGVGTNNPTQQLEITQSLEMPNTIDATTGVIYKGTTPFLHNYTSTGTGVNVFLGQEAGNFTTTGLNNVGVGRRALQGITSGSSNTAVGFNALYNNNTGGSNVAFGVGSLASNSSGSSNISIGMNSMTSNNSSSRNIAIGQSTGSGSGFVGVSNNVFIGHNTATSLSSNANNNIALGYSAATNLTSGTNNIVIGYDIGVPLPAGSNQLTIGNLIYGTGIDSTGTAVSTGNIGIGVVEPTNKLHVAGDVKIEDMASGAATDSVVMWSPVDSVLRVVDAASIGGVDTDWTGAGTGTMYATDTTDAVLIGTDVSVAGKALVVDGDVRITGVLDPTKLTFSDGSTASFDPAANNAYEIEYDTRNLAFTNSTSDNVLYLATNSNVGVGTNNPTQQLEITQSLEMPNTIDATTGVIYKGTTPFLHNYTSTGTGVNVFLGQEAGNFTTTGLNNVGVGRRALQGITSGSSNTAVGFNALYNNNTGGSNVAFGVGSLASNSSGSSNISIGMNSMTSNNSSSRNIAIGQSTGSGSGFVGVSNNVFIGHNTATSLSSNANNNIALGYSAATNLTSGTNNIVIGYDIGVPLPAGSNQLTIGNLIYGTGIDSTGTAVSTGNIGIGVVEPTNKLHVAGDVKIEDMASGAATDSVVMWSPVDSVLRVVDAASIGGVDTDWTGAGTGTMYATDTTDAVLIGTDVSVAGKALVVDGDVRITGVLDPTKLTFSDGSTASFDPAANNAYEIEYDTRNLAFTNSTSDNVLYLATNSNVGVGTDNPTQQLEITQSLEMPTTIDATTGVIYKGTSPFLHDYTSDSTGNNVFLGKNAGNFTNTGSNNTVIGPFASLSSSTSSNNTSIGAYSLYRNQTGNDNITIGNSAGFGKTGSPNIERNVLIGNFAGLEINGGNNNIAIGHNVATLLNTGSNNIIIGYDIEAPDATLDNQLNIGNLIYGTGIDGLDYNISSGNIGIGVKSPTSKLHIAGDVKIEDMVSGSLTDSVVVWSPADSVLKVLDASSFTDADWTGTGTGVMYATDTTDAVLIGTDVTVAGKALVVDGDVRVTGVLDPTKLTFSDGSTASFDPAANNAYEIEYDTRNLAFTNSTSDNVLYLATNSNVGVGTPNPVEKLDVTGKIAIDGEQTIYNAQALNNLWGSLYIGNGGAVSSHTTGTEGWFNISVGIGTLTGLTTGNSNTALGHGVLENNTTGTSNVGIGTFSLKENQTGSNNVSIGYYAGAGNGVANISNNVFIGANAGGEVSAGGNNNIVIGYDAATLLNTGSNNIIIGYNIEAPDSDLDNQLNIGNLIYGTGIDSFDYNISSGNIGIGVKTPTSKLHIAGDARIEGALKDSTNNAGTAGQVLSSTGSGTIWTNKGDGAMVSRNNEFIVPSGVWTALPHTIENFDNGDYYDPASNTVFTVPSDGMYTLSAYGWWANTNTTGYRALRFSVPTTSLINGFAATTVMNAADAGPVNVVRAPQQISVTLYLIAGDQVGVQGWQNSGTNLSWGTQIGLQQVFSIVRH